MDEDFESNANESGDEEGFPDSTTRDFAMAMDTAWLKTRNGSFADKVREYHALESTFIARASNNDAYRLEIQRAVAKAILKAAVSDDQPFETCERLWNQVLRLGFSDLFTTCTTTWCFAECCRQHKQIERGLQALNPLISELERLLAEPTVTEHASAFYREQLGFMHELLRRLESLQK